MSSKDPAVQLERMLHDVTVITGNLLNRRGLFGLEGALQYCREEVSHIVDKELLITDRKIINFILREDKIFQEQLDSVYEAMSVYVRNRVKMNYRRPDDTKETLAGILKKDTYAIDRTGIATIRATSFSTDECFVLVAMFLRFYVPFEYRNKDDEVVDYFGRSA